MDAGISLFCFLIVLVLLQISTAQHYYDCPSNWQVFENKCYRFVYFPGAKYDQARLSCSTDGAALVSVNDLSEHTFIADWLQRHDPFQRTWLTSGTATYDNSADFVWKGDDTLIKQNNQYWLPGQPVNETSGHIAYKYGPVGYAWELADASSELSYICEIEQKEAYRIAQHNRDFDYGLSVIDPNNLKRGPVFTKQPESVVVVGSVRNAEVECVASGNPFPKYKIYRLSQNEREEITYRTDSRYTISNGRLSIEQPDESKDAGEYQCEAFNEFGSIFSNTIVVSFGRIGEFSNVPDAAVRANAYDGVAIQCSKISFKPAVNYQWMKKDTRTFVRPQLQQYMFISANGKLYFSEVTRADEGEYRCLAILTGVNKHVIGTSQPPTRTSLPIQLIVSDQAAKADWGPEIQNDFLAVFPQPPLRGHDVRLECFAYGSSTTPFTYTWHRKDKPIPLKTKFMDHNRILIIEDAQLEDQGTYTCVVRRGQAASDSKSITLRLGAEPYFIAPLRDQHVDIESQLTWRCEARANPPATYTWYKNGKPMQSEPGVVHVHGNVLTIESLNPKAHDGMYQCGAENIHGKSYSSAQLRVLSFEPNFNRYPMSKITDSTVGGNVTLMCRPEGAPTPEITWFRNGQQLSTSNGHFEKLGNGYLRIINLQRGDQGTYTCKAENKYGDDSDYSRVQVSSGTRISIPLEPVRVVVNQTAFIYCQASSDPGLDMVYLWKFNGRIINVHKDPHIRFERSIYKSGLYVTAAQMHHAGEYECLSVTPMDSDSKSTFLTVQGPPGEPGGVYVDDDFVTQRSAHVRWTPGASNGRPISYYILQHKTGYDPEWRISIPSILDQDTMVDGEDKRQVIFDNLVPNTAYYFRLIAVNAFGVGHPSLPSSAVTTPQAPPSRPPHNVRGGGGSVGDLTIRWDPLPPGEQGAPGIGYKAYFRKATDKNGMWRVGVVPHDGEQYVHTVGQENYYLEYEVMVQAYNDQGPGPNSTIEVVMSAADMPMLTPTNVASDTYNGTALEVTWEPIGESRSEARGKILGYQINYWPDEGDYWLKFIRHEGQIDTGLVIGLESDTNYWVDVQVYNSAGLGPRSESYFMETSRLPTSYYPEEVRIFSAGSHSCRVWWRGIKTTVDEAIIRGYRVYYWKAREEAITADTYDTDDMQVTNAVLEDLEKDVVYALRVGALSDAGEGKKSPTMYFTLGGQIQIDQQLQLTIGGFIARASFQVPSLPVLILTILCSLLIVLK